MRQDRRFKTGEAVTSIQFARLLSGAFDWLVTVDPHLHRVHALGEIYALPSRTLQAAPLISDWIRANVGLPLLIGPDAESAQWVEAIASRAGAPHVVLEKVRRGDRDVEIAVPNVGNWQRHTPVLVDDIISTARTMIETIGHLRAAGLKPPVCVGIHGVFAEGAYEALSHAGAAQIVSSNTIAHPSNAIDVTSLIADAVREMS
jgi:ribose-phosphate pyrophosphokinase